MNSYKSVWEVNSGHVKQGDAEARVVKKRCISCTQRMHEACTEVNLRSIHRVSFQYPTLHRLSRSLEAVLPLCLVCMSALKGLISTLLCFQYYTLTMQVIMIGVSKSRSGGDKQGSPPAALKGFIMVQGNLIWYSFARLR